MRKRNAKTTVKSTEAIAVSYTHLAEAYSAAHPDAAVYIQLTESIELDKTITVSGKVNIRAAKAGVTISRKEDGTFTGTMFSVSGEGGQLQFFADGTTDSTLTVSGKCSEDGEMCIRDSRNTTSVCKRYYRSDQGKYAIPNCGLRFFRCGLQNDSGYERC